MPQIIAIANHKGGVGKTATAVNLAAIFADKGYRTLLVDLDPQGNSSAWLNATENGAALVEALANETSLEVEQTPFSGLQLAAGGLPLAAAQKSLGHEVGAELLLGEMLQRSQKQWDLVFLDCPPSLGFLTINALAASTGVLLPLEAHPLGLRGLSDSRKVVHAVQKRLNPGTSIIGVVPCRVHPRRALHREVMLALEDAFPDQVTPSIRENVAVAEAPAHGLPINLYSPRSNGCLDYRKVANWLAKRLFLGESHVNPQGQNAQKPIGK